MLRLTVLGLTVLGLFSSAFAVPPLERSLVPDQLIVRNLEALKLCAPRAIQARSCRGLLFFGARAKMRTCMLRRGRRGAHQRGGSLEVLQSRPIAQG